MTEIIPFSLDEKIADNLSKDNCAFCLQPLVKGKFIATEDSPSICFECVKRCKELMSDVSPALDFDGEPE